jgi:hypothetical protein
MEEALRARALKGAYGRQNHRALSGLYVCCERALKSAGERNTHGTRGGRCGDLRETACTGGCGSCATSNQWRFGGAGVIPCWQIADCALGERLRRSQLACAHAVLAGHDLNIKYYIIILCISEIREVR